MRTRIDNRLSLAFALATASALLPVSAAAQSLYCPDSIEVSVDPATCYALVPVAAGTDPQQNVVLVEGINPNYLDNNGTSMVTVYYDEIFLNENPLPPIPVTATATFIVGTVDAVANQCTSQITLRTTTEAAVACGCPDGVVCETLPPIYACKNLNTGKLGKLIEGVEPKCNNNEELVRWDAAQ